ncbi:PREDICTED: protein Njmu-R1 [Nanorana parkeri]|uniref:protein Njmu-R1 n=1 Tax=Nanorana parkeri TaxID=125878 RepID=UPI0008550690|nr:PREDICTED: protein Njmu-R1 [Nanorana parkeri]
MLAAQSSLAESVDGEELRSDDGEERRHDKPTADYYCLYLYQSGGAPQDSGTTDEGSPGSSGADTPPGEDFSLSLVDTNLPAEAEPDLRNFMAKRLSRGAMFEGMGNVASVDLSYPECSLGCYYSLIQQTGHSEAGPQSSEHVVCFLGGSEKGLDLFRLELDRYVEELKTKIQMGNLDSDIRPHLSSWFEVSILPIQRIVNLFQEKLSYLLHAALSYTTVEVTNSDERTKNDVSRFLSSASLQGLVQEGTMASLCIAMTESRHHTVTVDFSDGHPELVNAVSNRFCEDWMQFFVSSYEGGSPFLFRQKLENFKLKAIQDMNNLKRLIRQAESSHHALFRCYNFLKNCGNGDLLLQMVKVEHAEMPEASSVVTVLEEFIQEEGFSVHSS